MTANPPAEAVHVVVQPTAIEVAADPPAGVDVEAHPPAVNTEVMAVTAVEDVEAAAVTAAVAGTVAEVKASAGTAVPPSRPHVGGVLKRARWPVTGPRGASHVQAT